MEIAIKIQSTNAEILQLKRTAKNPNEEVSGLKRQLAEQELLQTRLTRNVDTAESTFEILSKTGEETKISSSIKAATIQLSFPAIVSDLPIKPKNVQNILFAGTMGILGSNNNGLYVKVLRKEKKRLKRLI